MAPELPDVNTMMTERLQAIGLDVDHIGEWTNKVVHGVAAGLDNAMPMLSEDPTGLRVLAEALRSYGDVAAAFATAVENAATYEAVSE